MRTPPGGRDKVTGGCSSTRWTPDPKDLRANGEPSGLVPPVVARVVEQMPLDPLRVVRGEGARAHVDHGIGLPVRPASSVSMALNWARIGTDTGEPGIARARDTWRSRLARSSS